MEGAFKRGNYTHQLEELRRKIKSSEEQKCDIERRLDGIMREYHNTNKEKSKRVRALRDRYVDLEYECKERSDRNERLLLTMQAVDSRAATLAAKTQRMRELKKQYGAYFQRVTSTPVIPASTPISENISQEPKTYILSETPGPPERFSRSLHKYTTQANKTTKRSDQDDRQRSIEPNKIPQNIPEMLTSNDKRIINDRDDSKINERLQNDDMRSLYAGTNLSAGKRVEERSRNYSDVDSWNTRFSEFDYANKIPTHDRTNIGSYATSDHESEGIGYEPSDDERTKVQNEILRELGLSRYKIAPKSSRKDTRKFDADTSSNISDSFGYKGYGIKDGIHDIMSLLKEPGTNTNVYKNNLSSENLGDISQNLKDFRDARAGIEIEKVLGEKISPDALFESDNETYEDRKSYERPRTIPEKSFYKSKDDQSPKGIALKIVEIKPSVELSYNRNANTGMDLSKNRPTAYGSTEYENTNLSEQVDKSKENIADKSTPSKFSPHTLDAPANRTTHSINEQKSSSPYCDNIGLKTNLEEKGYEIKSQDIPEKLKREENQEGKQYHQSFDSNINIPARKIMTEQNGGTSYVANQFPEMQKIGKQDSVLEKSYVDKGDHATNEYSKNEDQNNQILNQRPNQIIPKENLYEGNYPQGQNEQHSYGSDQKHDSRQLNTGGKVPENIQHSPSKDQYTAQPKAQSPDNGKTSQNFDQNTQNQDQNLLHSNHHKDSKQVLQQPGVQTQNPNGQSQIPRQYSQDSNQLSQDTKETHEQNQYTQDSNEQAKDSNQSQNPEQYAQDPNQYSQDSSQYAQDPNQYSQDSSQYTQDPNQFSQDLSQYPQDPNQYCQDSSQYPQDPNQYAQDPNQYSEDPNKYAQDNSQYPQESSQYAQDSSQYPQDSNQCAQDPGQYSQDPNQYAQDPNQYVQDPAPYSEDPNQYSQDPSQYSQDPSEYAQDPNQYSQDPNQYAPDPTQYAQDPSQYAQDPNQYSQDSNQYPQDPNQYYGESTQYEGEYYQGYPDQAQYPNDSTAIDNPNENINYPPQDSLIPGEIEPELQTEQYSGTQITDKTMEEQIVDSSTKLPEGEN